MAMIARVAEDKQSLLQTETVWQKMQKDTSPQKEKEDTVIGKAAEVYISKEGRKLSEEALDPLTRLSQTDFMTDAEKQLSKLWQEEQDKAEYKKQAAEIEERLAKDAGLTDKEREDLQAQADKLKEKGMTLDDKLYALYDKKNGIEKNIAENDGKYMAADIAGLQKQIDQLNREIYNAAADITRDGKMKDFLTQQVLKERADLGIAANKAKIANAELELRDSEASVTTRTAEQIQKQADENGKYQPTAADVVQEAVEEGKARAEKAEEETGKLADKGRESALNMQSNLVQEANRGADAGTDEKIINHTEDIKKLTIEDALQR
ncbi:hypothetical protein [Selenomonas ruminantium]|uniref:hypothetical protein n=1 Tax=Selenomonas ruminantium TaxID=971 RepID=UPI00068FF8E0|nr:hypothetical protein [Selenomonas ruminantium]